MIFENMNMDKSRLRKIGYICLGIVLILFAINQYLDYKWERGNKEWEEGHEQLLQKALTSEDIGLCSDYKDQLKCIILIGKKKGDVDVCMACSSNLTTVACKAAILNDSSLCEKEIEERFVEACKDIYKSVLSRM